ncbi:ubiquinone anaerobic biosynthesis accessory factor UbiT [Undibacterium squillarum]|uniref:ubiquinone anaerobic biosynthesis accessory factor UbiT n=1 Tax=Undibacterium squillarum TaxID=1131567 RepID=UPI0035AEE5AB
MNASGFTAQAAPRKTSTGPRIPVSVSRLLNRLPVYPGSVLFVQGLNHILLPAVASDCRAALVQRSFRIEVADAGLAFHFTYDGQRFRAMQAQPEPDLCIRANAWDFHLLMQKAEDADTLFFSRRLTMTGDTELGVLIKNTLDALELPEVLPAPLRRFLQPQRRD